MLCLIPPAGLEAPTVATYVTVPFEVSLAPEAAFAHAGDSRSGVPGVHRSVLGSGPVMAYGGVYAPRALPSHVRVGETIRSSGLSLWAG